MAAAPEAHSLVAGLARFGNRIAAIDDSRKSISYLQLADRAIALCNELGEQRRLVLLEGENSISWLVGYVAALHGRHPVLIAPGGAATTLDALTERFRPSVRLLASKAHRPEFLEGGCSSGLHPDLAVMLSTSGSTGSTKCVRLSRRNIHANAISIADYLSIGADDRGTVNLPTHYSYGLSIVNSHLHAGATMLLTSLSVIDAEFWAFLRESRATSFAGVPHVYDLLARTDLVANAPPSLRYFTQAGGRLSPEAALSFDAIARENGWRFFVMYGQTEATARISYVPPEQLHDHPDCIGVPIPGGTLELMGQGGEKIDGPDVPGELVYRGPNVMMGYAMGPEDLAKPPQAERLETGDIACRTADGLYRIVGRKSRFVKIFGNRIGLDDVEKLLGAAGYPVIATGTDDRLLVVTRTKGAKAALEAVVATNLKLPRAYFEVREVNEYPLLSTGKIDYASLKASMQRPESGPPRVVGTEAESAVTEAFLAVFGDAALDPDASFSSLGGDSLNYVVVAMKLERAIPDLPAQWESLSIRQLVAIAGASKGGRLTTMETNVVFRALAICGVVAGHAGLASVAGGAHLLFMLAGYNLFRFRGQAMLDGVVWETVWSYLRKLVIPYVLFNLAYMLWKGQVSPSGILLYGNLAGPYASPSLFPQWFIEVLAQCVVALGVLFSFENVRAFLKRRPFASVLALALGSLVIRHAVPLLWNSDHLYDRVPWVFLPLIMYAWLATLSESRNQKWVSTVFLAVMLLLESFGATRQAWLLVGGLAVLWLPRVPVPAVAKAALGGAAAAAFFIYMLHMTFMHLPRHVLHIDSPVIDFTVGMGGPIALWWMVQRWAPAVRQWMGTLAGRRLEGRRD